MLHNGTKSDPVTPPSGGDGDENVTISLDATTKALPRLEEFVLEATVSSSYETITWRRSEPPTRQRDSRWQQGNRKGA